MKREDYKIHIVGAGISGLIAAKVLEKKGYKPTVIESTSEVGGRIKTDIFEGYQLDHGFQVLLNAYPKAIEYLDFQALDLQEFLPGATIFFNGKSQTIGDPLRNLSLLFPTLLASVGSISDKLKILKLNTALKNKTLEAIFESKSVTTLEYLRDKGFSEAIISKFFKPFFSGIFLEPNLETSSRMFEFVYKMFGEGLATLPKGGIGAIPQQLKSSLTSTKFIFDTEVKAVKDEYIELANCKKIDTHFTIITSGASKLISNLKNQEQEWKSCYNLYFETNKRTVSKPIIGLVADKDALINNFFFHNSLKTKSKGNNELLSVTVVKHTNLSEDEIVRQVEQELQNYCKINVQRHLKTYHINQALPKLQNLQYDMSPTETQIKPTIFLAGDYLLNGSLNAAMISGESAANGLIMALEDGLVVENIASEYI
ncbi:FAD-dependent oxidoreductase [Winogradskyella litorisediminis]|uniref:FAD-dependent oxidoreductase n=1 Tax=Winogradskyella litorisediminis TaxID=1156618 RepID=A0ABW3N5S6_9FLAO